MMMGLRFWWVEDCDCGNGSEDGHDGDDDDDESGDDGSDDDDDDCNGGCCNAYDDGDVDVFFSAGTSAPRVSRRLVAADCPTTSGQLQVRISYQT